jgi:hypothetical protein
MTVWYSLDKDAKLTGDVELGKRVHVDGLIIRDTCPKCKARYERDFSTHPHLSYPKLGELIELKACCKKCQHEWCPGYLEMNITVKVLGPDEVETVEE